MKEHTSNYRRETRKGEQGPAERIRAGGKEIQYWRVSNITNCFYWLYKITLGQGSANYKLQVTLNTPPISVSKVYCWQPCLSFTCGLVNMGTVITHYVKAVSYLAAWRKMLLYSSLQQYTSQKYLHPLSKYLHFQIQVFIEPQPNDWLIGPGQKDGKAINIFLHLLKMLLALVCKLLIMVPVLMGIPRLLLPALSLLQLSVLCNKQPYMQWF